MFITVHEAYTKNMRNFVLNYKLLQCPFGVYNLLMLVVPNLDILIFLRFNMFKDTQFAIYA